MDDRLLKMEREIKHVYLRQTSEFNNVMGVHSYVRMYISGAFVIQGWPVDV